MRAEVQLGFPGRESNQEEKFRLGGRMKMRLQGEPGASQIDNSVQIETG